MQIAIMTASIDVRQVKMQKVFTISAIETRDQIQMFFLIANKVGILYKMYFNYQYNFMPIIIK